MPRSVDVAVIATLLQSVVSLIPKTLARLFRDIEPLYYKLIRTAAKSRAEKPRAVRGSMHVGENCGVLTRDGCLTQLNLRGYRRETVMDAKIPRYSR